MVNQDYTRYHYTLDVDSSKKVKSIDYNFTISDAVGDINVTDLQLQSGRQPTAPIPHSSQFLQQVPFTLDENEFLNTVSNPVKEGVQPQVYKDINNRIFNILGRGSETLAFPNVVHGEYSKELVTSALDLKIIPKDDYDLLRISTNHGSLIEDRQYDSYDFPPLAEHSLNRRYTREFYFTGGKAGDEIDLKASEFKAVNNGVNVPLMQGKLDVAGTELKDIKQRFMLAPYGAFRVRIEFYKKVTETLRWGKGYSAKEERKEYFKDVGIGFYGYGEFKQYERGDRY